MGGLQSVQLIFSFPLDGLIQKLFLKLIGIPPKYYRHQKWKIPLKIFDAFQCFYFFLITEYALV